MSSSISSSKFLGRYLALLVIGVLLIGGWNLWIDPFDLYHDITVQGWTHVRSRNTGAFDRMTKAHQIARRKPEGLLLGTSRVDWAIDPHHPALQAVTTNYLNAALAGATMYELYRTVQHAQALHPLKQIVIGLDLETFNPREDVRDSFSERRLAVTRDGRPNPLFRLTDLVPTLFTQDALQASAETIRRSRERPDIRREELLRRGHAELEDMEPEERWRTYRVGVHQARANLTRLGKFTELIGRRLDDYANLLRLAHQHDIDVRLFITPYHVSHLEVIRASGNWRAFDWWKGELLRINEAVAAEAGRDPFPLWDFSGYHPIATEPHPTPEDTDRIMTWYRESSHYRKITGDLILDRIFGRDPIVEDFGIPITPETIHALISYQRKSRDRYLTTHRRED